MLICVGLRWPVLTCVDTWWPELACVDLSWLVHVLPVPILSQNYPRILVRSDISVKDFYLAVGYSFFEVKSCSFPALASYFPRKCIVLEGTVGLQFIIPKQRTNFVRPCLQKLRRRSSFCWDSSVAGVCSGRYPIGRHHQHVRLRAAPESGPKYAEDPLPPRFKKASVAGTDDGG